MSIETQGGAVPEWTLGDRLRKARELTGMGQKEFAERLGVSRNTVGSSEADSVEVRKITLNAWSMATGVDIEWLEHGTGTGAPIPPPEGTKSDLDRLAEAKRGRTRRGNATARYVSAA